MRLCRVEIGKGGVSTGAELTIWLINSSIVATNTQPFPLTVDRWSKHYTVLQLSKHQLRCTRWPTRAQRLLTTLRKFINRAILNIRSLRKERDQCFMANIVQLVFPLSRVCPD